MKKIFVLLAGALLICGLKAEVPGSQELSLEQKADKYHETMNEADKKYPANKKLREEARLAAYKKASEKRDENKLITALNPPECKYYSTEGICCWPATIISPYPEIAHVNTLLNFKFPKYLANYTAQGIHVYSQKQLGYSIKYWNTEENVVADVYIYDIPLEPLKHDLIMVREAQRMAQEIIKVHQDVRFITEILKGHFIYGDKTTFWYFIAHLKVSDPASQYSGAVIFSKNQKFIKIRISQIHGTLDSFRKCFNEFLGAIDKMIILDSQSRKKKFEKKETFPIILP